jgi:tellurite resistance protein
MLTKLDSADRLRLMRFVCSFAWADLEVRPKERALVRKMMSALKLDPDEIAQVKEWLEVPPRAEEVDPGTIPREHRQLFLDAARAMIAADGQIDPHEHESLKLLEELLQ